MPQPRYSNQYESIRDAAHQRTSSFCSSRAIVRHYSFWIETDRPETELHPEPRKRMTSLNNSRRKKRHASYYTHRKDIYRNHTDRKELLLEFYHTLKEQAENTIDASCRSIPSLSSITNDQEQNNPDNNQSLYSIVSGSDKKFRLYNRIIVSKHYNRVSFKHFVDLEYKSSSIRASAFSDESILRSAFDELDCLLKQYRKLVRQINKDEKYNPDSVRILRNDFWSNNWKRCEDLVNFLYEEFWDTFDEEHEFWNDIIDHKDNLDISIFGDFRGLIYPASNELPIQREGNLTQDQIGLDAVGSDEDLLKLNWPIVKASEYKIAPTEERSDSKFRTADSAARYYSPKDIIACSVLGPGQGNNVGAAIYVSSLGQSNLPDRYTNETVSTKKAPIRYLVLSKTENYRRIGRLVDRIDRLGAYRLLALREFEKVRNAGVEIQRIGELIDDSDDIINDNRRCRSFLRALGRHIESLGDEGQGVEGGLYYRTYVSEHYANALKEMIALTGFARIPGFESYEDFVRRQLYQIYHYNAEVGRRLAELRNRYSMLVDRSKLEEGNRLRKIGHAVEYFAVTYYGGSILKFLMEDAFGRDRLLWESAPFLLMLYLWWTFGGPIKRLLLSKVEKEDA